MSTSSVPSAFDEAAYVEWHNATYPDDSDLRQKVASLRDGLKLTARPGLEAIGQVLDQVASHTLPEARLQSGNLVAGDFRLPSTQIAGVQGVPDDSLFKPTGSIIEKIWRRNSRAADDRHVRLSTLTTDITDLVRTSVVAPTMFHARLFAERLGDWRSVIESRSGGSVPDALRIVERIEVDAEAKLASGYFAYHALARCAQGTVVEVQVYSEMTRAWRAISHLLYERSRVGESLHVEPGSRDARLVSLGHLLHLAECEHERLLIEFRRSSVRRSS